MAGHPPVLWRPDPQKSTNLDAFRLHVNNKHGLELSDYHSLYEWSVQEYVIFWEELWNYLNVQHSGQCRQVLDATIPMDKIPKWFQGVYLNYAENLLQNKHGDRVALYALNESVDRVEKKTFAELRTRVALLSAALRKCGVKEKDVVAGYLPNICEAVEAMLATASIGAVWSSTSPDFGVTGVLDRLLQIKPKVLFSVDSVVYNGKCYNHFEKLTQVVKALPYLECVVLIPCADQETTAELEALPKCILFDDLLSLGVANDGYPPALVFTQLPFDHPLFILFSSGTTGPPKCMVHSVGGTLLKHLAEHVLQSNMNPKDILLYYTSTGWMMWNWMVSALAVGSAIVLYDGSPLYPSVNIMWDVVDKIRITILGTGAKWLSILHRKGVQPKQTHHLKSLHTLLSTGSPLSPDCFDYVYQSIKSDVLLGSITGGSDIIACFAGVNPTVPVYRGEIQTRHLGMAVESWDERGKPVWGESGELVCVKPFPSMPTHFWNDPEGLKYYKAYFTKFQGVWCHGDFCQINRTTGGIVMLGRSDGTLNPSGIRFGSAEIYQLVEQFKEVQDSVCVAQRNDRGEERVVLFLKMVPGHPFTPDLLRGIQTVIRSELSPRHLPAVVMQIDDVPYTTSGKKVEIAVRKIISGETVKSRGALINPDSLDLFYDIKELCGFLSS